MSSRGFGLAVQRLDRRVDRVLVLARLVALREGEGWASPGDIRRVFELLQLPHPGNVSQALGQLRDERLVVRHSAGGSWAVTPEGRERVAELIGELDPAVVEAELVQAPGALFSQARHPLIPPELAPARWAPAIGRLLSRFPFDSNVFCMTRFPKDEREVDFPDPVREVIATARTVLSTHGLTMHLASDRNADDELFGNVAGHMWACKYGLGLFETRFGRELNDNMLIEVGGMIVTGRRCALLKDRDTPELPTDLVGHIYKPVDFDDIDAVGEQLHRWAADDLGLGRCPGCPPTEG